jgi:hypothetical protein
MTSRAAFLAEVCTLAGRDAHFEAAAALGRTADWEIDTPTLSRSPAPYPTRSSPATKRRYTARQATAVFVRDGFVDRYSGNHLIFPGVLRLLSHLYPREFPYHPNWKFGVGHAWYWDLFPTVDHLVPVTIQGADEKSNWLTTSMRRNLIKSNRSLESLGWQLFPPGDLQQWDGMYKWFRDYVGARPEVFLPVSIRAWYREASRVPLPNELPTE